MMKTIGPFLLASVFMVCTACGGGSQSRGNETIGTAENAGQPPDTRAVEPDPTNAGEERQPVAGETTEHGDMGHGDTGSMAKPAPEPQAAPTAPAAEPMAEPNIFAMLTAANEHEIAVSRLALEKSNNAEVKKLAKMMVKDHQNMLEKGQSTAKKLKIEPADNADVTALRDESKTAMTRLQALEGEEFDRAFMEQMVTDHEKVLAAIDGKLMPAAQDEKVKALLTSARPKVEMHLDHARKARDKMEQK